MRTTPNCVVRLYPAVRRGAGEVYRLGVSEEICKEVIDILDMYRLLHAAAGLKSAGFDGNEETDHYAYAGFTIEDMGRWSEFAKCDLNSHTEMLPRYRKMLEPWEHSPNRYNLTKADAESIIRAGDRHT